MMQDYAEAPHAGSVADKELAILRLTTFGPVLIGVIVLAGWALGLRSLETVLPGLTTMKVNTALGLVTAGGALLVLNSRQRRQGIGPGGWLGLVPMCGAAVFMLGTLTLGQYASGYSFGLDELVFTDPSTTSPPYPGRMAPATAIGLASIGLSILLLSRAAQRPVTPSVQRCASAAHLLAAIPAGVSYVSLAGYIYDVKGLYSFGPYISVALNTAAAFAMLTAAILYTIPDLGWRRRFAHTPLALSVFRHLLPFSLLVPFALGAAVVWGARVHVYDPLFGPALFALAAAGSSIGLVWLAAGAVRKAERMMLDATESRDSLEHRQVLLRGLVDQAHVATPSDSLANTASLLARHFDATRVGYGEADESTDTISITYELIGSTGAPSRDVYRLGDFGVGLFDELRSKRTVVVRDVLVDRRTRDASDAYVIVGVSSFVIVPLVQDGLLRAILFVAHAEARAWTPGEIDLVEGVALRSWATIERVRAENALQKSEARLRATFEAAPVGIIFADSPSGRLVYGNAAVEQIFRTPMRYSADAASYDEWHGFHADGRSVQSHEYPLVRTLQTAASAQGEYHFDCGDGVRRWVSITTAPVRDGTGRMTGVILVCADIDDARRLSALLARDRAELEALVEERTRDLQDTQTRLAHMQRMEALGQLAGGIAHDFNNVLQAVQGGASLIERRPADPEGVRRLARMIFDSAGRGSAITRRLLAFSRRGDLRTEAVSPVSLLTGMREILTHTLGAGVGVRVDAADTLPMLLADKGQLETVLVNLATNARDAMDGSGLLTMAASVEAVGLDASARHPGALSPGCYVCLSVIDTGSGMQPDVLARATEPFFTTKEPGKGTGLGLAMARGFAEQSGGGLLVQSEPGAGTTVKLWFPVVQGALVHEDANADAAVPGQPAHARLLVVDDDAMVREVLVQELEANGFAVLPAIDGPAALALLDLGEAVDLIVSDLSMPGMDGVTLVREAQRRRPKLPAVILTGFATNAAEIAIGGAVSGAFTLLRKPVSGTVLAERVAVLLEGVAATANPAALGRHAPA